MSLLARDRPTDIQDQDNDNSESSRRERWTKPLSRRTRSARPADDEFEVDADGNEDAWVHDGVDDIQIDPETKRAASELSYDEQSIDAEYEPKSTLVNKTRITTIAEVIPMVQTDGEGPSSEQHAPSLRSASYSPAPGQVRRLEVVAPVGRASELNMAQVEALWASLEPEDEQRPLLRAGSERARSNARR